jgi:hypothetical protein
MDAGWVVRVEDVVGVDAVVGVDGNLVEIDAVAGMEVEMGVVELDAAVDVDVNVGPVAEALEAVGVCVAAATISEGVASGGAVGKGVGPQAASTGDRIKNRIQVVLIAKCHSLVTCSIRCNCEFKIVASDSHVILLGSGLVPRHSTKHPSVRQTATKRGRTLGTNHNPSKSSIT